MEKITKASVISRAAVADSAKPDIFDNLIKATTAVCLTGDVCADAAGPFSARVELASGGPSLRNIAIHLNQLPKGPINEGQWQEQFQFTLVNSQLSRAPAVFVPLE